MITSGTAEPASEYSEVGCPLAFICIGLELSFKQFGKLGVKPTAVYLIATVFNARARSTEGSRAFIVLRALTSVFVKLTEPKESKAEKFPGKTRRSRSYESNIEYTP